MTTRNLSVGGQADLQGAVSLKVSPQGVQPWRIDHPQLNLYEPALVIRGMDTAGVRLTLRSDTAELALEVDPCLHLRPADANETWMFDLLIDGQMHQRIERPRQAGVIQFTGMPARMQRLEVYLPIRSPVLLRRVSIDAGAAAERLADDRPRWVVYGSSITQCRTAAGPCETWPAIVARRFDLNLTCLGYGGNCHLEPMVARTIRDLPADYISLCLGINVQGGASLSNRTFRAAVIGLIKTIRDRHPHTPIVVVSPICSPPRETTPNAVGMTLADIRTQVAAAVEALTSRGDANLCYFDGLELFGQEFVAHLPDLLHPDAQGYRILAQRYGEMVMPRFGLFASPGRSA